MIEMSGVKLGAGTEEGRGWRSKPWLLGFLIGTGWLTAFQAWRLGGKLLNQVQGHVLKRSHQARCTLHCVEMVTLGAG